MPEERSVSNSDMLVIVSKIHDLKSKITGTDGYTLLIERYLQDTFNSLKQFKANLNELNQSGIVLDKTNEFIEILTTNLTTLLEFTEKLDGVNNEVRDLAISTMKLIGKKDLKNIPVNLVEIIEKIFLNEKDKLTNLNIDLQLSNLDKAFVRGDPALLSSTVKNLLYNAIEAVSRDGRISIALERTVVKEAYEKITAGIYYLIKVTDNGCGISEQDKSKIFNQYFTTKEKGSGIGLVSVMYAVNFHGGFLEFESEEGKGSTFKVYLKPMPDYQQETESQNEIIDQRKNRTDIMLVDDEDFILRVLGEELAKHGFKTHAFKTSREAIEGFKKIQDKIKLAVIDMKMPDKNGLEIYQELKKTFPYVRVVIISALVLDDEEIVKSGVLKVLEKPDNLRDLAKRIADIAL